MIRFYAPDIESTGMLPESESGHCVRVLRKKIGDSIEVVDGAGNLFRGTIADANHKAVMMSIEDKIALPKIWAPSLTVAVAPTKNIDRMEWLVEKLVEIGIDRFVPLRCEHSERKELKIERIEKIAVSAMKQSLKAVLPQIDSTISFANFIAEGTDSQKFVGYCDADTPRRLLAQSYTAECDMTVMIGPEGDFSPAEISAAISADYIPVTMGDNRLRTETAALVAADTFHIINQLKS